MARRKILETPRIAVLMSLIGLLLPLVALVGVGTLQASSFVQEATVASVAVLTSLVGVVLRVRAENKRKKQRKAKTADFRTNL